MSHQRHKLRRMLASPYYATIRSELGELLRCQSLSQENLQVLQEQRLTQLLRHAYNRTAYYQSALHKAGVVNSSGNVDLSRFSRLPLLNKRILRQRLDELKSSDLDGRRWYFNTSGGSTGEPVKFIQDAEYRRWARATKTLFDSWTGFSVGDPKVLLWGSERDLFVGKETLRVRGKRWLRNETWQNAFRMTPDRMRQYVEIINRVRPTLVLAYAESIYEFARFIERDATIVHTPEAIMTSAGTLHQEMRVVIERVFGAPVYNRYGSREVSDMACECNAHQGLHVSPLTHYLEILREDGTPAGPGERGEVVVTSLTNYAMPFIRYSIGDTSTMVMGSCSCGCSWPLLKQVHGRLADVFVREDGGVVVPEYFIHTVGVVLYSDWIRTFQCIQEDHGVVRVLIVPTVPIYEAKLLVNSMSRKLEEMVRLVMGERCNLLVDIVDDIELTPSGKHRYVLSRVGQPERIEETTWKE